MRNEFDAVKFAVACKRWRNMHYLTAHDMAELNAMAASTYSFVENGDRPPTMGEFSKLCKTMGFEAAFFFKTPEKSQNARN